MRAVFMDARLHWFWRMLLSVLPAFVYLLVLMPTSDLATALLLLPSVLTGIGVYAILTRYLGPRAPTDSEPRCRICGHILRGIKEPRCPECGERI
jgi:hypothetical protein